MKTTHRIAILPGTFDPLTLGHLDLIERGKDLFDELIVAIGVNPDKTPLLSVEQRIDLIEHVIQPYSNVGVLTYTGLTVNFAKQVGATVMLRGLRDDTDLPMETALAQTNRAISDIETLFLLPAAGYAFIHSSLVRQIHLHGGDVSALVPAHVSKVLKKKG
jgi:pantetheine-phosphate adenylyltransferase